MERIPFACLASTLAGFENSVESLLPGPYPTLTLLTAQAVNGAKYRTLCSPGFKYLPELAGEIRKGFAWLESWI
jgi:hypothetical protein